MSAAQARMFIERVHRDNAFRARVMALTDVEERMAFIRSQGFECSAAEISGLLDLLSDVQLEAVRGGWGRPLQSGPLGESMCGGFRPS